MPTIRLSIEELKTVLERSKEHLLRPINDDIVAEFADAMKAGEKFPDMLIGTVSEKDGSSTYLVDGFKRATAYLRVKSVNDVLMIPLKTYTDKGEYLADMLLANMAHGERVTGSTRDVRIRLLCADPAQNGYGWTQQRAAHKFGLTQQSISKIVRYLQEEGTETRGGKGKTRPKPKSKAERMQAAVEKARELGPMPFLTYLASVKTSLKKQEGRVELLKSFLPRKKDTAEVKAAKAKSRTLLHQVVESIQTFAAMTEQAIKKGNKREDA